MIQLIFAHSIQTNVGAPRVLEQHGDDPVFLESRLPMGTTPSWQGGMAMDWIVLFIAGLFEIAWAIGLKYTEGFTRFWPSVATLVCVVISMGLLGLAVRHLPVGTAYAVWTGIGAAGTVLLGIILFGESASFVRLGCVGLILIGIIGLQATSST